MVKLLQIHLRLGKKTDTYDRKAMKKLVLCTYFYTHYCSIYGLVCQRISTVVDV